MTKIKNYILAIDPAGKPPKGVGTNGLAVAEVTKQANKRPIIELITLHSITTEEPNWKEHLFSIITLFKIVVLENFRLQKHKALQQAGSELSTVKLIGEIEAFCRKEEVKLIKQDPSCKYNVTDKELVEHFGFETINRGKTIIYEGDIVNRHQQDSLRHLYHYAWKWEKEWGDKKW